MNSRALLTGLASLFMMGCAHAASVPPLTTNDPANPSAFESPVPARSPTLDLTDTAPAPVADAQSATSMPATQQSMPVTSHDSDQGKGHGMEGMERMDHPPATTSPSSATAVYTCPMHAQILSGRPGKCPICGMKLIRKDQ